MKIVDSLGLRLTIAPAEIIASWPPDRSFKILAEDARARRRRAIKGVGVEIQRGLFVQVARRLDGLALELPGAAGLQLSGATAEAWLQLDEILTRVEPALLSSPALAAETESEPLTVPVLGEQVLFPGTEVTGWCNVLERLDAKRLCQVSALWRNLGENGAASLLAGVRPLFQAASQKGCAIIQVLFDAAAA